MLQHEGCVIIQVAVVLGHFPLVHEHELVAGRAQQVPVVRDKKERALERGKRHRERFARCHVKVVRRLVKHKEVGLVPGDECEGKARLLSARHCADLRIHEIPAEAEPPQVVAQLLLAHEGRLAAHDFKRRLVHVELLELVLGKVSDHKAVAAADLARKGRERPGNCLDER